MERRERPDHRARGLVLLDAAGREAYVGWRAGVDQELVGGGVEGRVSGGVGRADHDVVGALAQRGVDRTVRQEPGAACVSRGGIVSAAQAHGDGRVGIVDRAVERRGRVGGGQGVDAGRDRQGGHGLEIGHQEAAGDGHQVDRVGQCVAGRGRPLQRCLPGHGEVVAAAAFLLQGLHVVTQPSLQTDHGRLLLGVLGPLARAGPSGNIGDSRLVGRILVRREPQLAGVVAGNPEPVVARDGGQQIAAHPAAVIVRPVAAGLEQRAVLAPAGAAREARVRGQVAHGGAGDAQPVFPEDAVAVVERRLQAGRQVDPRERAQVVDDDGIGGAEGQAGGGQPHGEPVGAEHRRRDRPAARKRVVGGLFGRGPLQRLGEDDLDGGGVDGRGRDHSGRGDADGRREPTLEAGGVDGRDLIAVSRPRGGAGVRVAGGRGPGILLPVAVDHIMVHAGVGVGGGGPAQVHARAAGDLGAEVRRHRGRAEVGRRAPLREAHAGDRRPGVVRILPHAARQLPAHGDVVPAGALLGQRLDVILAPGHQRDRSRLLRSVLGPLARAAGGRHGGNPHLVCGVLVGRQPQLAGLVGRDPEDVIAGGRRMDVAAHAGPVVVVPVHGALEEARVGHAGGVARVVGAARQVDDLRPPDAQPVLP